MSESAMWKRCIMLAVGTLALAGLTFFALAIQADSSDQARIEKINGTSLSEVLEALGPPEHVEQIRVQDQIIKTTGHWTIGRYHVDVCFGAHGEFDRIVGYRVAPRTEPEDYLEPFFDMFKDALHLD
jgi:hypothetical protein